MMMDTNTVQSAWLLIIGVVAIIILLRILVIVHRQSGRFKELEQRMNMMENVEDAEVIKQTDSNKEQ